MQYLDIRHHTPLNSIHIWHFEFKKCQKYLHFVLPFLSNDELAKAHRFFLREDQEHYQISHGLLRLLLSSYIRSSPGKLQFDKNIYGKPFLSGDLKGGVNFNISHTKEELLMAFSPLGEIGVDIETIRQDDFPVMDIAERFFSPYEMATLRTLEEPLRKKAFFLCWTRKEAFIKAIGLGLSFPLNYFDVSLIPGESARLLRLEGDVGSIKQYEFWNLEYGDKTAAALCCYGHNIPNIDLFDGNKIDIPTLC